MIENVLPEIPRLYTAFAEWAACLIFIILLKKRFSILKTIGISVIALTIMSVFLVLTDDVPLFLWIPCMAIAYLFMVAYIYTAAKATKREAFYFGVFAFVVAEFMASLDNLFYTFIMTNGNVYRRLQEHLPARVVNTIELIIIISLTMLTLISLLKRYLPTTEHMDFKGKDLSIVAVTGIVIFSASNVSFLPVNTMLSGTYTLEIEKLRTIIDLVGIVLIYAQFGRLHESYVQHELEAVQNVLENQYQQYKQSRESIDLINIKYHDLKHQIAVLRAEENPEKRNAFLDQMENEIKKYELQNKTGNKVLDTVLTSKSMYCDKHGITLTCVADGSILDFMDTMDISSVFGNALDNAIESELKIEDKEKRLIHLTVAKKKNFAMIRIENYFEGNLEIKNGKIKTTKKNAQFHGYGIKSIRYVADKYNGAVDISTKDNWFDLKILIPIKD